MRKLTASEVSLIRDTPGYEVVETDQRVGTPDEWRWGTRFRRRAERRCARTNAHRLAPSYRYEVVRDARRWRVIPFQNVLVKKEGE